LQIFTTHPLFLDINFAVLYSYLCQEPLGHLAVGSPRS
jgi:hypothetical protein